MQPFFAFVGTIAALGTLTWGLAYHDLIFTGFFGPKYENVRRKTFEHSKSYRDGTVQELQNMQFEYIKAAPAHRGALADLIRQRAVSVPPDAMPIELQNFISTLPQ